MSDQEIRSVSDPTLPNAGRIYDYILGGNYNYEIDRKIADDLLKKMPIFKKVTKIIRWFLGNVIDRAFKMGFTQFLDFASGIPNVDHIHTRIPANLKDIVKIVYSDIDPVTVQIGKEIIKDTPGVKYLECDCRKPEMLLESDSIKGFFNKNKKIVIGLSGILYFLTDVDINHIMKTLYDWAPAGSIVYFCDSKADTEKIKNNEGIQLTLKYYEEINQPFFLRTQENLKELIKPWKVKAPGLQTLVKWLELSLDDIDEFTEETGGLNYGGFLEK